MEEKTGKGLTDDWIRVKKQLEALELQYQSQLSSQGAQTPDSQETAQHLFQLCCREAMQLLGKGDQSTSLGLLRRAESLAVKGEKQVEVWKCLACYYGSAGKHFRALTYLDKAHELERRLPAVQGVAKTHLNYCAILSQLGRHDKALSHALKAVMMMQDDMLCAVLRGVERVEASVEELAMAYYNLAVEFEHQKEVKCTQYGEAMKWYKKAKQFSEESLPEANQCRANLSKKETLQETEVSGKTERRRQRREMGEKTDSVAYLTDLKVKIQTTKKGDTLRKRQLSNLSGTLSGTEDSRRLKGATSLSPTSRSKAPEDRPFVTSLPSQQDAQSMAMGMEDKPGAEAERTTEVADSKAVEGEK